MQFEYDVLVNSVDVREMWRVQGGVRGNFVCCSCTLKCQIVGHHARPASFSPVGKRYGAVGHAVRLHRRCSNTFNSNGPPKGQNILFPKPLLQNDRCTR